MSDKKNLSELSEKDLKKSQEVEKKLDLIAQKVEEEFAFLKKGAKGKISFVGCYVNKFINKNGGEIAKISIDFFIYEKKICAVIDYMIEFNTYRMYASSKKDNTDIIYNVIDELEEVTKYNYEKIDYKSEKEWTVFPYRSEYNFKTEFSEIPDFFKGSGYDIKPVLTFVLDSTELKTPVKIPVEQTFSCFNQKEYVELRKKYNCSSSRDEFYEHLISFFE